MAYSPAPPACGSGMDAQQMLWSSKSKACSCPAGTELAHQRPVASATHPLMFLEHRQHDLAGLPTGNVLWNGLALLAVALVEPTEAARGRRAR